MVHELEKCLRWQYSLLVLISFVSCDFELNLLHTNDVHSRIEQVNTFGGTCSVKDEGEKKCFGGVARRYTVVKEIRAKEKNVILLDGGDQYQGTLWFGIYKGDAAVTFMNLTQYDAMTLGNHEFDHGPSGIVPFVQRAAFPIVSCNIDVSDEPLWPKPPIITKSTIIERSGVKIGVIGYIIPETSWLSTPGPNIKFHDVIPCVRAEARRLKASGVKILIGLGHSGYTVDQNVAKQIEELDIVVGGHTNTFLYTGSPPSVEKPEGPYPVVENHADGTKALVVQDFTFGKYLGHLKVIFDDEGNVKSYGGNPILLNSSYEEDPGILKIVHTMDGKIKTARNESIGKSFVFLNGGKPDCRQMDCNLGNLVADGIVKMSQKTPDQDKWANIAMGFWNGGGLRSSISKTREEAITLEDLSNVLPFGNNADIANITGKTLRAAIEHGVAQLDILAGRFMIPSGIRYTYDPAKPVGQRVQEVRVICTQCQSPTYEPLNDQKFYLVITSSYLLQGGDGYHMLKNVQRFPGESALDLVRRYVQLESPLVITSEDRARPVTTCSRGSMVISSFIAVLCSLNIAVTLF